MEIRKKIHVRRVKADGFGCNGCVAAHNTALCKQLPRCTVTPADQSKPSQAYIYIEVAPSTS